MVGLEGRLRGRPAAEARRPRATAWIAACALLAASAAGAQATWTTGTPMPTPRTYLATGVAGGQLYVALGAPQNTRLEAYDPETNGWTVLADLWPDRSLFAGDVIDGKLYVAGGCINTDCNPAPTNRLDVYDPVAGSWGSAASMPTARHSPGVAALSGKLYVVGGGTGGPCCPVVGVLEAYDPATDTWQPLAPMPTAREALVAVALGGKLYAIGGQIRPGNNHSTGQATGVVEVYDPLTNSWSSAAPMPTERTHLEAAVLDGRIHVLGGSFFDSWPPEREWVWFLDTHEIYDPVTDSWSAGRPMPTPRFGLGVESIGGRLYAVGGSVGPFPPSSSGVLEIFSPEALQPGDILVADYNGSGPGRILEVDPVSGAQSMVSEGGLLDEPWGMTLHPQGYLLVADRGSPKRILRVDPASGSQQIVAEGGLLVGPMDLDVDAAGDLLVADHLSQGTGAILKVELPSGAQSVVATGGAILQPMDVTVGAAGEAYVSSFATGARLVVVKVDPADGTQTVVSPAQWHTNVDTKGIVRDEATGDLYVTEIYTHNGIFKVDGDTGVQSLLYSGYPFQDPWDLTWDLNGNLVVGDGGAGAAGRVIRIDPADPASPTVISSGGLLVDPAGIAVVPPPNQPPTADAGPDRAIHAGVNVELDGGGSWDDNTPTADLLWAWSFSLLPAGSEAVLSGADTPTPSFMADLAETYGVRLVVTDEQGLPSAPDEVLVSAENLPPTANAGEDQLAVVGTTVELDGTGSHDPEYDPLSFAWSIAAAPAGSVAALAGADTDRPTLVPDLEGLYRMSLVVSDFLGPGWPDAVEVTATTAEDYAQIQIVESGDTVEELLPAEVTTQGNQKAYLNFLSQALLAIQESDLETAIHKLEQAIERTDGCALRGAPDGNGPGRDWITDCTAQAEVYLALTDALAALQPPEP